MNIRSSIPSLLAGLVVLILAGCNAANDGVFPGYAEGEYVRIASPYGGSLASLNVRRGDTIAAGAPLFALEQENERAARAEAAARVNQAESQLENLRQAPPWWRTPCIPQVNGCRPACRWSRCCRPRTSSCGSLSPKSCLAP